MCVGGVGTVPVAGSVVACTCGLDRQWGRRGAGTLRRAALERSARGGRPQAERGWGLAAAAMAAAA